MDIVIILIVSLIGVVVLQLGFIFLLLALMPSIVAFFVDTDNKRSVFKVVGCCNLASTLPQLIPMLKDSMNLRHHYDIETVIMDPTVWMFIYLGAASGWGLIYLCRYISRFVVTISYEYNINNLKRQQRRLIEEWGEEVAGNEAVMLLDDLGEIT